MQHPARWLKTSITIILGLSLVLPGMQAYADGSLPHRVDMSGELPPVGCAREGGNVVAWAAVYYAQTMLEGREQGWDVSLPEHQFSPEFPGAYLGTSGMSCPDVLEVLRSVGVLTLEDFPLGRSAPPESDELAAASRYRIGDYAIVGVGQGDVDVSALKSLLAQLHPIMVAIPVYDEFLQVDPSDPQVGLSDTSSVFHGAHCLLIVGYDDEIGGFKAVNSWGETWGDGGYCYLTYDLVQQQAYEAWVMYDGDFSPPSNPTACHEIHGCLSGIPQDEIEAPSFSWSGADDARGSGIAGYRVYWGPDSEGVGEEWSPEPSYSPGAAEEGTFHLRVQTVDSVGNGSEWSTLFTFVHRRAPLPRTERKRRLQMLPGRYSISQEINAVN